MVSFTAVKTNQEHKLLILGHLNINNTTDWEYFCDILPSFVKSAYIIPRWISAHLEDYLPLKSPTPPSKKIWVEFAGSLIKSLKNYGRGLSGFHWWQENTSNCGLYIDNFYLYPPPHSPHPQVLTIRGASNQITIALELLNNLLSHTNFGVHIGFWGDIHWLQHQLQIIPEKVFHSYKLIHNRLGLYLSKSNVCI